jgi:hypothetical protein
MLDERTRRTDEVSDLLDTVKAYAKQETVGPLKGAGRAIGLGAAGVVCLGIGLVVVLVGLLRLLQTETSAFDGDLMSVIPYLICLVVAAVAIYIALSLIKRIELDRGDR